MPNPIQPLNAPVDAPATNKHPKGAKSPNFRCLMAVAILTACFGGHLYQLAGFALQSDFFSYILLVPLVSGYLIWLDREKPWPTDPEPNFLAAAILLALGVTALAARILAATSIIELSPQDALAVGTLAFVFLLAGICAALLPRAVFSRMIFPLAFLLFMVPLPVAFEQQLETLLQHGSAAPAAWFFRIAGTPLFRQDLVFQLPGINLQIAPECSGIRSTLVLFMTSLIAGHFFLRSPWKRATLALAIIPLALVRNGLRVFTIGQLCVQVGPHMIDSDIHHKGGPIFFALSLIPLFLLVYYFVKTERRVAPLKPSVPAPKNA